MDVPELSDAILPLKTWKIIIDGLIEKHGPDSVLKTDAGYNNVGFYLEILKQRPPKRLSKQARLQQARKNSAAIAKVKL